MAADESFDNTSTGTSDKSPSHSLLKEEPAQLSLLRRLKPKVPIGSDYGQLLATRFPQRTPTTTQPHSSSSSRPLLLPVIHIVDEQQTLRNVEIAIRCGCDGVWLIDHFNFNTDNIERCFKAAKKQFPQLWIGVNLLQFLRRPLDVFSWIAKTIPDCDGLWSDASFIDPVQLERQQKKLVVSCFKNVVDQQVAKRIRSAQVKSGWKGLYFGGVAFKGQQAYHPDQEEGTPEAQLVLDHAARLATHFMDVVITSGYTTGVACSPTKLVAMQSVRPLAVSGLGSITAAANRAEAVALMKTYCELVDVFFFATQVCKDCPKHGTIDNCKESFCEFDESRVQYFVDVCNEAMKEMATTTSYQANKTTTVTHTKTTT
eukprot:TRINITY_DN10844_c0_g1_i1.p1 TRINITY_DN10844_c0_g1~~TRINITY_DN10844_c0_g1_i1.p1  ORF type:complete len:380 (+),score=75.28 TRINITY_DN10844_c0_g1_i1:25-1140(+)